MKDKMKPDRPSGDRRSLKFTLVRANELYALFFFLNLRKETGLVGYGDRFNLHPSRETEVQPP
jgi:hypothetical protein